ncbi:MAG: hypothetical protein ACKER6_01435 [Candidatus Hodgkinia cicadicola]
MANRFRTIEGGRLPFAGEQMIGRIGGSEACLHTFAKVGPHDAKMVWNLQTTASRNTFKPEMVAIDCFGLNDERRHACNACAERRPSSQHNKDRKLSSEMLRRRSDNLARVGRNKVVARWIDLANRMREVIVGRGEAQLTTKVMGGRLRCKLRSLSLIVFITAACAVSFLGMARSPFQLRRFAN